MLHGTYPGGIPLPDRVPEMAFIGRSPAVQRLTTLAKRVAVLNSTIMLTGETGTGKETFARLIHENSRRAPFPFIPVDCTALPEGIFESELFGHVRGAFTGAHRDSLGYVRSADKGTLFLDEIGELSLGLQSKLLRVLQERRVVPVGASRPQDVDIRVICATNRDLPAMVTAGNFRQDLFFRLAVVSLELPPLRERPEDVIPLAEYWLNQLAEICGETLRKISPAVAEAMLNYRWPGNIRELFNVIEHARVLSEGPEIALEDLPPQFSAADSESPGPSQFNLETMERKTIVAALNYCNFNRTAACRLLGVELRRLNRRMASLKIEIPAKTDHASRMTGRVLESSPILQRVHV